jgi:hypothetical protein
LLADIASVVIKGTAADTEGSTDHFGFVAEQIGKFKADDDNPLFQPGPGNDMSLVGSTGDLQVLEVVKQTV